jgi:hypothetical protein
MVQNFHMAVQSSWETGNLWDSGNGIAGRAASRTMVLLVYPCVNPILRLSFALESSAMACGNTQCQVAVPHGVKTITKRRSQSDGKRTGFGTLSHGIAGPDGLTVRCSRTEAQHQYDRA